jgi:hypothetical protein
MSYVKVSSPCGGGLEYFHCSPASRKRRQKGTQRPGVYVGHPDPGGYKYGDLALQVGGVSRIGTIKYGLESSGTQTRAGLRWRGPAATVNERPIFSSERLPQFLQSAHRCLRLLALRVGHALPLGRFLVLISFRGRVNTRAIVWLVGSGQLKNPAISLKIEPTSFWLGA